MSSFETARLLSLSTDKSPEQRAELLETTTLFADVHKTEASAGQSSIPENLDTNYHFTCFVQGPSAQGGEGLRLIELDGRRAGPIDRGASTDLLKVCASFLMECEACFRANTGLSGLLSGRCNVCDGEVCTRRRDRFEHDGAEWHGGRSCFCRCRRRHG